MTPEQAEHLQALQDEFYADETEHERRVAILLELRPMAAEMMPESRCIFCKQPGLDVPWDEALVEGHCYSPEGVRDYTAITKVCEFCFDKVHEQPPPVCPECEQGKHVNCTGEAWDFDADEPTACQCPEHAGVP